MSHTTQTSIKTMSFLTTFLFVFIFLSLTATTCRARVADSDTFTLVNSEEFGDYVVEYDGNYRPLSPFAAPFQLCFYNTTPNAFTLAVRIGLSRSESLRRWVWEANRNNPVGENATFSLRPDGNLVLAHSDGRVAWETKTANKGVVGFKLLPTGNMVLVDKSGGFVWQSFDSPTDTLLVGQSLRLGGVNKLVSRLSASENKGGPYSLVLNPKGLSLYYKKMLYWSRAVEFGPDKGKLTNVTFLSEPDSDNHMWDMSLTFSGGSIGFSTGAAKYNGTLSFLRLGIDGNLRVYTYDDIVDNQAWDVVFTAFDRSEYWESECQLPERCGNLGVCEDNQCVACPTERGLLGWSKACGAKKVISCDPSQFSYYKVEGVDHFLTKFNRGSDVSENDCGEKCTSDCKCKGYFYNKDSSRCWVASELKTLTKVANSSHVGFIKTPKSVTSY